MITAEPRLSTREIAGLSAALVIAAWLRLPGLDTSPPGFFCDEASVGYDAVALLETGADQYGHTLPLFARSFGDWDEASYRYLALVPVAILGPTVTAVRLPAALSGIVLVAALFFLARRWFGPSTAVATALLAAASPWTVLLSRMAFRGILAPTMIVVALVLFERARARGRGMAWTGVAFALALWTYTPARLLVPAIVLSLAVWHGRSLWRAQRNGVIAALAVLIGALVVLGSFWISPEGTARARAELRPGWAGLVPDYLSYLRPGFLFDSGDPNLRHSFRGWGQLLPLELLSVAWGLYVVLRRRHRTHLLVLAWIALAIVPAALTLPHHALRAIAASPALTLLSGLGAGSLFDEIRARRARRATIALALATYLVVGLYPISVEVRRDYPTYAAGGWQWGMREGIAALEDTARPCRVVSNRLLLPHIFVLFFGRVPPRDYQARPITTITQIDMAYERWELGPWRVLPIPDAVDEARACVFLGTAAESSRARAIPGYRLVHELRSPSGVHELDVFLFDEGP